MRQKCYYFLSLFLFFSLSYCPLFGQTEEQLANGYNFMETQTYSEEENAQLLKLYEDLRVADVSDGMDYVGLPNKGLVDPEIQPEWVDRTGEMSHVIRGIALTVRYVPTQRPNQPEPGEDFSEWAGHFYGNYSPEPFVDIIQDGTVIVRDGIIGREDSGIGSNNILNWVKHGAVGVITNATARDTDEIALQEVPLYLREKGRGIRPGRSELESVNRPVNIGGVLVRPGDVVVADGDGVIVVPRKVAREVAEYAHDVLEGDQAGRRELYEDLGIPLDETVK